MAKNVNLKHGMITKFYNLETIAKQEWKTLELLERQLLYLNFQVLSFLFSNLIHNFFGANMY